MAAPLQNVEVARESVPGVIVSLPIPNGWDSQVRDADPALVASIPAAEAGPFGDNLIVSIERLDGGLPADLAAVRAASSVQLHATVPDLHVIDDRAISLGATPAWFRALSFTAENHVSVVSRQVMAVVGDVLVTIILTSFPFRDRESTSIFASTIASTRVVQEEEGQ